MTAVSLRIAAINIQDGGVHHPFGIDHVITELFASVENAPGLIVVNEAKHWLRDGHQVGLQVAALLSDIYGPRYQIRVGHMDRAPVPPAIIWDPALLALTRWEEPATAPNRQDSWNRAVFHTTWWKEPLTVMPIHWHPWDRADRMRSAHLLSGLLGGEELVVVAGDTNSSPSGRRGLWPTTDFEQLPFHRRHHKGWQPSGPAGPWVPHTAPLDHLLGVADPITGERIGGIGWETAIETAWRAQGGPDTVFPPTVNDGVDEGAELVIDHILLSEQLAAAVVSEETAIHLPRGLPVSDHRMVTTALRPATAAHTGSPAEHGGNK